MVCRQHTQRSEKPSVLPARIAILQNLLDGLLGILALGRLLERVRGERALKALELESVASRHEMVVVDGLDEGLDLVPALLPALAHPAGDSKRVSLDADDEGVAVRVQLGALVHRLDDHNLEDTAC